VDHWSSIEGECLQALLGRREDARRPAERVSWQDLMKTQAKSQTANADYLVWLQLVDPESASALQVASPIVAHIISAASRLLMPASRHFELRTTPDAAGREIVVWRWVSASIPVLTLCAAHPCAPLGADARVRILRDSIAPTSPAAVLHVHHGQLHSFEQIWDALVNAFVLKGALCDDRHKYLIRTKQEAVPDQWRSSGRTPGTDWEKQLLAALAVRRWLATRLLGSRVDDELARASHRFAAGRATEFDVAYWGRFRRGASDARLPISEYVLQRAAFRAVIELDAEFANVFVQYLRTRSMLFLHLVHPMHAPGLDAFVRSAGHVDHYEAIGRLQRLPAIEHGYALRVSHVEMRCSPDRWMRINGAGHGVVRTETSRANDARSSSSWIIAFDRTPATSSKVSTRPAHYDAWRKAFVGAEAVLRHIQQRPSLLANTRGIDVMGREQSGPLWVVLPHVLSVLEGSRAVARRTARQRIDALRLTLHVGEDFDHVLTGLRRTSEPLLWNVLDAGDRLGHATALGLDMERWTRRNAAVTLSWWDRYLDLGWAVECAHRFGLTYLTSLAMTWAEEARRCEAYIFGEASANPLLTAREVWQALGDRCILASIGFPSNSMLGVPQQPAKRQIARYLFERKVYERAIERTCVVHAGSDLPVMQAIQQKLITLFSRLQLVIEVQPSSNLFVGGVAALFDQPFFQIAPPTSPDGREALSLAISSDDPLVFATTTEDEYAYAWAGMVEAGVPASLATNRLEHAARASIRACFAARDDYRAAVPCNT
jgi:hypothetical protein